MIITYSLNLRHVKSTNIQFRRAWLFGKNGAGTTSIINNYVRQILLIRHFSQLLFNRE